MKRMTLIAIVLGLIMIATTFAGIVTLPATAQTVEPSTMQFRYNAQHTGDYSSVAGPVSPNSWKFGAGNIVYSSPAVVNGVVYVGSYDHNVYALNAQTGAKIWSYKTGSYVSWSSPAVADGVVYVGSFDHNVYALNAQTGAKIWSYTTGDAVWSSPAVSNGVVYVGSTDHKVYALNAQTGAKILSYTTGNPVFSSPAVANGVVYIGSVDHNVYAIVAAQQPASSDKVLQFDVKVGDTVKGKIIVNTNNMKYVLNVRGLSPGTTYWLGSEASSGAIASVMANPGGAVHLGGTLSPAYISAAAPAFYLSTKPLPSTLAD